MSFLKSRGPSPKSPVADVNWLLSLTENGSLRRNPVQSFLTPSWRVSTATVCHAADVSSPINRLNPEVPGAKLGTVSPSRQTCLHVNLSSHSAHVWKALLIFKSAVFTEKHIHILSLSTWAFFRRNIRIDIFIYWPVCVYWLVWCWPLLFVANTENRHWRPALDSPLRGCRSGSWHPSRVEGWIALSWRARGCCPTAPAVSLNPAGNHPSTRPVSGWTGETNRAAGDYMSQKHDL